MSTYQKTAYQKKLDDPRWQKKRLEVLERAGWKCQDCDESTAQLHVHHIYYVAKRDPWEYPNSAFQCLCKECHDNATEYGKKYIHGWESAMGNLCDDYLHDLGIQFRATLNAAGYGIDDLVGDVLRFLVSKIPPPEA